MKYLISSLLFLIALSLHAETNVYRTIDEDGNPVFSDEPSAGSEAVELQEVQTVPAESVEFEYTPSQKQAVSGYEKLLFINPANDTAVRENAGNLTIQLQTKPELQPGHRVILYYDGSEVARGPKTTFTLENLDRGTHSLSASIATASDKVLIESETITFTLLRHSSQHPKPAPPPAP